jgi:hypothetical protein
MKGGGNMVLSSTERLKFFVYVIESPSAPDLYHGKSEGSLLKQAIGLHGIPCIIRITISRAVFEASIKIGLAEAMKDFPGLLPILHISAHGGPTGIQLSNEEIVSWSDLKNLLLPINRALNELLILCMSSCEGFSACTMAMDTGNIEYPFFAVIGHTGSPTWADTAIAYTTFYHLIAKGEYVVNAVEAMKIAAGDKNFFQITAIAAQERYLSALSKLSAGIVQTILQQEAEK